MDGPQRPMGKPVIKVVAAVIERDGRILVGQRRKSDSHGLKWEFPGGKVERGEAPLPHWRENSKRNSESRREWDAEIVRYFHEYPKRATILLMFFRVTRFMASRQSLAFESIVWEAPEKLPQYDFLDGDVDFVRRLASGEYNVGLPGQLHVEFELTLGIQLNRSFPVHHIDRHVIHRMNSASRSGIRSPLPNIRSLVV